MKATTVFTWIIACAAACFPLTAAADTTPSTATISVADPAAYTQQIAEQMTENGVEPLRPLLTRMYAAQLGVPVAGIQLPPQLDAQFTTMQTAIAGRRAIVTSKLDDVMAGDAMRAIFYYHYFGDNVWVFSRFLFVRIGEDRWALSTVTWGGTESIVGLTPQPNYHSVR